MVQEDSVCRHQHLHDRVGADVVRRSGGWASSILAWAGIAGIIIGFAAQKTIANLFAGFQLALTMPIRIHDVVIVENEWGRGSGGPRGRRGRPDRSTGHCPF